MATIPVNFITSPEDPRIGAIVCSVPYIRRRVLDYLRQYPEVEKCGRVSLLGSVIYFRVKEGLAAANTAYKIHITFPMFIAEDAFRRSWIRRNFWLLWGAVLCLLHLLDTVDYLIEGSGSSGAFSWGFGLFIAAISLMNYTIGIRRENELLAYVRERCIKEIKIRFTKEAAL